MQGVRIIIDASDLDHATSRLMRLDPLDTQALMTDIAAIGESQTRRRIEEEKTAPDGSAWPKNVEGTSILLKSGRNLRDSISSHGRATEAVWGASWEFAHVHQEGAVIRAKDAPALKFVIAGQWITAKQVTIPPRPFVGLSTDNESEIGNYVTDYLLQVLQ